jgi:hypothetical protein
MSAFSKMVLATAITLCATEAFANEQISCTQTNSSSGSVIWEFSTTSLPSQRLASNIIFNPGSGVTILSAGNVAQYVANASQLYILVDDAAGNITQTFSASPTHSANPAHSFSGVITTFTANEPSSVVAVKCTTSIV